MSNFNSLELRPLTDNEAHTNSLDDDCVDESCACCGKSRCHSQCLGVSFLVLIVVSTVSGFAYIALGLTQIIDVGHFGVLLQSNLFLYLAYGYLIFGSLLPIVCLLALVAWKRQMRLLLIFVGFMFFAVFVFEGLSSSLYFLNDTNIRYNVERNLNVSIHSGYGKDSRLTEVIDKTQIKFSCCGSMSSTDWKESLHWSNNDSGKVTPNSCCPPEQSQCLVHTMPSCAVTVTLRLHQWLFIMACVVGCSALLRLCCVILTMCLARRMAFLEIRRYYGDKGGIGNAD